MPKIDHGRRSTPSAEARHILIQLSHVGLYRFAKLLFIFCVQVRQGAHCRPSAHADLLQHAGEQFLHALLVRVGAVGGDRQFQRGSPIRRTGACSERRGLASARMRMFVGIELDGRIEALLG
jgi:hypothetical protein